MTFILNRCSLAFSLCFLMISVQAQTLSGTLTYTQTRVTALNPNNAEITVTSTTGFAIGDRVLLIQMQGAVVNTSNNDSFGNVTDYNGAGSYEVATVCWVNGNQLIFENELLNDYDVSEVVQAINIPQYDNLVINGDLTSPAWNGIDGGVLVLEAKTIDLQADIDMSEKGFRGAAMENDNNDCSWITPENDYSYSSAGEGAPKGEGIVDLPANISYGKGAAANGGGGGNDHNSGGGGGGNLGNGGQGGTNGATGLFDCKGNHPGVGGKGLSSVDKIYLGGGGGAGHGNNFEATSGGNGGGIIILISPFLVGNGYTISSNGESALNTAYGPGDLGGDGAGAGGAGGSVCLDIPNISGNLTVEVMGGDGGDVVHTDNGNRCFGPGGGGSGGVIKANGSIPGTVTMIINGGANGTNVILGGTCSCPGSAQGAASGQVGIILPGTGSVPESNVNFAGCNILPVELLTFEAIGQKDAVEVFWTTLSEYNNDYFLIERSPDGTEFQSVGQVQGSGNSLQRLDYTFTDDKPLKGLSYYRLVTVDFDGEKHYSPVRAVKFYDEIEVNIFPNPGKVGKDLTVAFVAPSTGELQLKIFDMMGRMVTFQSFEMESGENQITVSSLDLPCGSYLLKLESGRFVVSGKLVVVE